MREYFLEDGLHPEGGITVKCKDDNERPCACFAEAEKETEHD